MVVQKIRSNKNMTGVENTVILSHREYFSMFTQILTCSFQELETETKYTRRV